MIQKNTPSLELETLPSINSKEPRTLAVLKAVKATNNSTNTITIVLPNISGTKGLPEIIVFWILEGYI